MKQNNDVTKAIFPEKHLPPHMRLGIFGRIIRFIFGPLCLLTIIWVFNIADLNQREISKLCEKREMCRAYCESDAFGTPEGCPSANTTFSYYSNKYDNLYVYDNSSSDFYKECQGLISDNIDTSFSNEDGDRKW